MKKRILLIVVIVVLAKVKGVEFTPEGIERAFVRTVTVCGNTLNKTYKVIDKYLQQHGITGGDGLVVDGKSADSNENDNVVEDVIEEEE